VARTQKILGLYVASGLEERAVRWMRASYGNLWRKRVGTSVSEEERRLRTDPKFRHLPHAYMWAARPFGHRSMNVYTAVARQCLRRNRLFPHIARKMASRYRAVNFK
jgi:hypothetical protein